MKAAYGFLGLVGVVAAQSSASAPDGYMSIMASPSPTPSAEPYSSSSAEAPPSSSAPPSYACNPAHSYPGGASCIETSGTVSLVYPTHTPMSNGTLPEYTTTVVTAFTTYCPSSTQLTYNNNTITVSSACTVTITDCPCTITTPVSKPATVPTSSYHVPVPPPAPPATYPAVTPVQPSTSQPSAVPYTGAAPLATMCAGLAGIAAAVAALV